jgi:BlaI family penicillinase repressor
MTAKKIAAMSGKPWSTEVLAGLSRRERQIMEIVYARGAASSVEVRTLLPDPPSYSAVRAQMRILVEKGRLKFRRVGLKYVFEPTVPAARARQSALSRVVRSFFNNSPVSVVATLLDSKELDISEKELRQLKALIAEKQTESKRSRS